MNYIKNLLKGQKVEWKTLGEVCELQRGKFLSKSDKDLGEIPFILYGELYTTYGNHITSIVSHTSESKAKKATIAYKEDILLPISSTTKEAQIGKASVLKVDFPVYIGGDALILSHKQHSGYLIHLLNSTGFEREKMKCVKGTTIMHLSAKEYSKIKIPLPPLAVQQEIAKILDKFCELEKELEKELELRKKQYEYYRNNLLSFNEIGGG